MIHLMKEGDDIVAGAALLVDYRNIDGIMVECWKLSNCERKVYPRDRFYCEQLVDTFREWEEIPLMKHEVVDENCINVYILTLGRTKDY